MQVFFETDGKHAAGSSTKAYSMAVSSAGGAAFTQGTDSLKAKPKQIFTFKFASVMDGSLNNPEDLDVGYTLEMAIPWMELGVKAPEPGTMMSFNVVIRMKGEANKMISLSPKVQTEQDVTDASKWVDIVFTQPTFGVSTVSLDKIVSARYITRVPLVDGQVRLKEYNTNTSFALPLGEEIVSKPRNQFQRMLLTYYFYDYQADPHKSAPLTAVRSQDGRSTLTDQPIRGLGPWFSYDRVQWHKEELSDMKRAGIDIVLPVYSGDAASQATFANKGLDVMVEALRELKTAKKPYPLVGLYLDTNCMTAAYGGKSPDLRDEEVKRTLYGMIRSFYERIPDEFRAQVQMADDRATRPAYIVQLLSARPFSEVDAGFVSYVNQRFAKDFGANIMWLGGNDFKEKADLDGYCRYGAGLGFTYDDTARIRIAAVGAGYDDCAVAGSNTPIRSREGGDVYRTDWSKALDKRPNWVIVDAWNRFLEGSDVCGSRQYGFTYVDATGLQSLKLRGPRELDAKYMRQNVPSVILPDTFYQVDVLVQNDGIRTWKASDGYALGFRWYQDGRLVGDSGIKRPLQNDVLPGQAAEITLGIAAVKEKAEKLAEGKYEVRLEMVRLVDNKWFSSLGGGALSVPITVGKPEADCRTRYLTVDGPVMLRTGTDYVYKVRVRNDGTATWKAGTAAVGARLYKTTTYVQGRPDDSEQEITIAPVRTVLAADVAPGQVADVAVTVNMKDAAGSALLVWKQSDPWSYQLRFDVWDGSGWISGSGAAQYRRIVDVLDADYGANIVACDVSDTIDAGKTFDVKLVVRNMGTETWMPGTHSFGYHWYYLDGTEAQWDGQRTGIKAQVKPGEPAIVTAKLTTPAYDGRYILAWDFSDKNRWASTSDISRGGDLLPVEVTVQNGKLSYADMSKIFDVVASSPDRNRESGNFDGQGSSFPAEFMPPDIGVGKPNSIYPCGYNWTVTGIGLESSRRISFLYGPKAAGEKNAAACAGQTVVVPKAKYAKIHVLAAATEPDQAAEFGIGYLASVEPAKLTIGSWKDAPAHGEEVALASLQRHTASGDVRGANCYLFHYTIPVDASRQMTSIVLPKNDMVRVFAITLEKP